MAHELGFSETIFIDDHVTGELQIFTPAAELPARGPSARRRRLVPPTRAAPHDPEAPRAADSGAELRPPGGLVRGLDRPRGPDVDRGTPDTLPDWTLVELGSPAAIEETRGTASAGG